jgi:hypothetical protein
MAVLRIVTECILKVTERLKGRLHKHCRVCTEGCIECIMRVVLRIV